MDIRDYGDDGATAFCPKCGVDSVVPKDPGLSESAFAEELFKARVSGFGDSKNE